MKNLIRRTVFGFVVSTLLAMLAANAPAIASSTEPVTTTRAGQVLRQYAPMLLKIRGLQYATVVSCDLDTGVLLDLNSTIPGEACVALKFPDARDVLQAESVFGNPLTLDGVLFHFTDRDLPRNKGGITVGN